MPQASHNVTIDLIMAQKPNKDQFTQFFVDMENKWLKTWYENGVVEKYLHKNDASEKRFSFQDGPITANNPMGVHHAWGRTYKDLWQKFHNLTGHKQRFHSGFDCQGLWVEVEVEKELGIHNKQDIENLVEGDPKASIAKFVQLCKDRVHKYADIQTEQSKRLGYFADWEHSYYTMSDENNYMIWHFLKTCHENGWIYKGHESVPWCPRCETAISQHEMLTEDYKEVVHESVYLKLPLLNKNNEYFLVWTTTPWTIPANIAVAVGEISYVLVEDDNGDKYYIAEEAVDRVFGEKKFKSFKKIDWADMIGWSYQGAFDNLPAVSRVKKANERVFHTIVGTDNQIMPISADEGTGLVHTAVSAGTEDFKLGKKRGLPMIEVIADNADYLDGFGDLSGKNAKKHPELIIDYLKQYESGKFLLKTERYKHRYPACWRCKTELVWKVADEWYIAMDRPSADGRRQTSDVRTLRQRMMEVAKKIEWMPAFGLSRELDWLKNMHDWLISKKNRYWGLALPIYVCSECEEFTVLGSKEELKEKAVKGWEEIEGKSPHKPFIDEVIISCPACGKEAHRIGDVGNPWLDAGIVPYSTIKENNQGEPLYTSNKEEWKKWFPVDFITESFPGQFKNWFYAMIAVSAVLEDTNPFKRVLGFATLLAEDGKAMHKSTGNSIEFNEGADDIGVDVMRWAYIRHKPSENLLFGYTKTNEVRRQFYLLLWNTYKYYQQYSEIDGFTYKPDVISIDDLTSVLDQWMLMRLKQTQITVKLSLETYDPRAAADAIESLVSDTSTWYVRRSRNREDKQDFYKTISKVLVDLSIIMSPLMPFITEELYTSITGEDSVHLSAWPEQKEIEVNEDLIRDMATVRAIVEVGHKVRKDHQIKVQQPLAQVVISFPTSDQILIDTNIKAYSKLIAEELNVKSVEFSSEKVTDLSTIYDTTLAPELRLEGELRGLLRNIQVQRKKLGINIEDSISLVVPEAFREFENQIQNQVQAQTIEYGPELKVEKSTK